MKYIFDRKSFFIDRNVFYSHQKTNNSFAISRRKSISSHNLSTFLIFWLKS